jgi:hypothetical protein
LPSPKRSLLTANRLLLLGAIAGSIGTFWCYMTLVNWLSISFPTPVVLVCLVIGAFSGIGVTSLADEHSRFRWAALAAAIFIGMMVSFVAYLILSFLAGPT